MGRHFVLIFLALLFSRAGHGAVSQNGDFQIWERNFLIKHFDERWSFWTISELRWGDVASKLYYALLQGQLYYRAWGWLVIGPGYSQVWTRETTALWKPQYLPFADAILKFKFSGCEIHDRNRLQYLIFGSDPSQWLYRNRFRIIAPSMLDRPRLSFFTDNEFFWLERQGISEERASAGLMIQWEDNWGGELFYMARFLKQTGGGYAYMTVLTGALLFSF